jgi:hypothetical protein
MSICLAPPLTRLGQDGELLKNLAQGYRKPHYNSGNPNFYIPPLGDHVDRNDCIYFFYSQDIHKELEQKIARFHGKEDSILYISCFDANAGIFEVMLTPDDAVISDELNHASIIDGIRLCKAKRLRYKHMDMAGTFQLLIQYTPGIRNLHKTKLF